MNIEHMASSERETGCIYRVGQVWGVRCTSAVNRVGVRIGVWGIPLQLIGWRSDVGCEMYLRS